VVAYVCNVAYEVIVMISEVPERCYTVTPVEGFQKWIIQADYLPDNPMDTPRIKFAETIKKGLGKSLLEYFYLFFIVDGNPFTPHETNLHLGSMICRELFMVSVNLIR
jgi:hypothetical protein